MHSGGLDAAGCVANFSQTKNATVATRRGDQHGQAPAGQHLLAVGFRVVEPDDGEAEGDGQQQAAEARRPSAGRRSSPGRAG